MAISKFIFLKRLTNLFCAQKVFSKVLKVFNDPIKMPTSVADLVELHVVELKSDKLG